MNENKPDTNQPDARREDANTDRRDFIKGVAAASILGAVGMSSAPVSAAAAQTAGKDLPAPPNMRPGAQVDGRYPISFQESVPKSLNILSQYFLALSERNLDGMASLMQYPFLTHEGPDAILVESKDKLMSAPPLSMNVTGKGDSKIKPGSYDILDYLQMHIYSPIGAGLTLEYSRYEPNGNKLFSVHGIYGVTNNDGHWGIEWASTIFKPANQVMRDEWYNYPIANYALHESHRDHVMARRYNDVVDLRRTVFDPYPHGALWIGQSNSPNAAAGRPMDDYKIAGVKSRLRYSPGDTQEEISKQNYGQQQFSKASGGGVGTWTLSIETPDTRMLYSSAEKGHFYSGYYRYTQEGSVISEHRYLGALVNRKGTWYGNDITRIVGHTVYQDRTNDASS